MTRAIFNLMAQAEEQRAAADKFMADALRQMGKADMTVHEPGDIACRRHFLAAQRDMDRAERCLRRYRSIVGKILELRPEAVTPVKTDAGPRLAIDNSAPTITVPINGGQGPDSPSAA